MQVKYERRGWIKLKKLLVGMFHSSEHYRDNWKCEAERVLTELKGTKVEVDALMKIMLELVVNDQDAYMIISIVRAIMRTVL